MIIYPKSFSSEKAKRALISEYETGFETQLDAAVREITETPEIYFITLSGPSCSGKTTTANKLTEKLENAGHHVHAVSLDDFYYNREFLQRKALENGEELDYDSIKAVDLDRLEDTVSEILYHRDVYVPIYDFASGERSGFRFLDLSPGDVIIFEGIQAIFPEVVRLFSSGGSGHYKSIYINVAGELEIGGRVFFGRELRFLRRLVRDFKYRSSSPEFTYDIWESVCRNEDVNMTPYAGSCDIGLNSIMGYGPGVIKEELIKVLQTVDVSSEYYDDALDIISSFERVEPISAEYLPDGSVYHEFIG